MAVPAFLKRAGVSLQNAELVILGTNLNRDLRSAHLSYTAEQYLRTTRINSAATTLIFFAFFGFVQFTGYDFGLFALIPPLIFWIFLFALCVPGMYLFQVYYPVMIARGRKSKIDLDLPYAVSYMQALSTTMSPFEVVKRIYEEKAMFNEVSLEFGQVVRDVELFGDDLITALHNLQKTTPSPLFRDFVNDLGVVYESGGDITAYLSAKTEFFHEQAKRELDLLLKTIEIMAEVYVSAFVAGPIALIIMIVAQGMTSAATMTWLVPFMYLVIPVGAIIMIWMLSLMLPPENLEVTRREMADTGLSFGISADEYPFQEDQAFLRSLEAKRQERRIYNLLRHPFRTYISNYNYSLIAGVTCAGIFALTLASGGMNALFPKNAYEGGVCLIAIGFMAPVSLAYEGRRWYVINVENNIPEFLRELSDMIDIGLTLPDAIHRISNAKLGLLSSELAIVSRDVSTGAYVNSALVRMEERIGVISVKRAISLLVKASEVTSNLRDIFVIAITDFEHYLKLRSERANTAIVYVMIIYLSFGIYLYTAYQLNGPFMSSFSSFNLNFNIAQNVTEMFDIAIALGLFSGIMAGQFSSNSILAGFKHSIVLLAAAVAMFVFIV
ncbi:type II secretion system protein [Methanoregula boonei 6A8]|jgi:flagellar protein FlaJ|uniref:Type II secretion system protein n=1 Tax=Methanoregula boonei (strain DSM 21154 / JCM 14090 / 6A8) TaxID=456442 RepID=A7IAY8_METB6|nr:type II secretion system F family protein [Methanoregula boonei]ABS56899.1 type II secretion system protein [Methanoregula boonei 6A8]